MICNYCGQSLEEGDKFCVNCGNAVTTEPVKKAEPIQNSKFFGAKETDEQKEKNRKKQRATKRKPPKWKWPRWAKVAVICSTVLVLMAAVLVPVLIEKKRANRYETAINLMDDGEMEVARNEFISLKTYKESENLAAECQSSMDYDDAKMLMKNGDYELAKADFVALGEYSDAADQAISCQNAMDYNVAIVMMENDENEDALEIFVRLGGYLASKKFATECQNRISYYAAVAMVESQKYSEALTAFKALGEFRQSHEYILECEIELDYAEAIALYDQGDFYDAYCIFDCLSDFADANQYASACIQDLPKTSEIYRNDEYNLRRVSLNIYGPKNDEGILSLVKVYTLDDELVSVMFINGDDKLSVKLPSGNFFIKRASGYTWFGEEDMFGDEGQYEKLLFTDNDFMWLSSKYVYTLRFSVTNGNIDGDKEDRSDF